MNFNLTRDGKIAIGDGAVASAPAVGCLDGVKMHLVKDDAGLAFDGTDTLAALLAKECDYTGYAAKATTWGVATLSDTGQIEYPGDVAIFRPTGTTIQNVAKGFYLTDTAATKVYGEGKFDDEGEPMGDPLDAIKMTVLFRPGDQSLAVIVT